MASARIVSITLPIGTGEYTIRNVMGERVGSMTLRPAPPVEEDGEPEDPMELAWGLIANAVDYVERARSPGSREWMTAMRRWRDEHWHPYVSTPQVEAEREGVLDGANTQGWRVRLVVCVECPECLFTFAAEHTDDDGKVGPEATYTCPSCTPTPGGPDDD